MLSLLQGYAKRPMSLSTFLIHFGPPYAYGVSHPQHVAGVRPYKY